jgi:hypothetical protein
MVPGMEGDRPTIVYLGIAQDHDQDRTLFGVCEPPFLDDYPTQLTQMAYEVTPVFLNLARQPEWFVFHTGIRLRVATEEMAGAFRTLGLIPILEDEEEDFSTTPPAPDQLHDRINALWPDPFGNWTADQADAAKAMRDAIRQVLPTPGSFEGQVMVSAKDLEEVLENFHPEFASHEPARDRLRAVLLSHRNGVTS